MAPREVQEKKYPPEVNYFEVFKGMIRVSPLGAAFHILMAILLITGLMIDLLGPWLGGWLHPIRSIAHGYVGAIFVLVFAAYMGKVLSKKSMRMVLTAANYADFVFCIILIITGITMSSVNAPWIDWFPELAEALFPLASYAPAVHVITTYIWIAFSVVFQGGMLHGLASLYLISHLKKKQKIKRSGSEQKCE